MEIFSGMAQYYDLIYSFKDYRKESVYIHRLIKKFMPGAKAILDLGCGTGNHDFYLSKSGYKIHGIDLSREMIKRAKEKARRQQHAKELKFSVGDIRHIRLREKYDVAVSLFYAMCYFTGKEAMKNALRNINRHLKKNGLFIFDTWHAPAVLHLKPKLAVQRYENDRMILTRISEPELLKRQNCVHVNFSLLLEDKKSKITEQFSEKHQVRYWSPGDLKKILEESGFEVLSCEEWISGRKAGKDTWGVVCITRKK